MKDIRYWGATFSHRTARQLGASPLEMLQRLINLDFDLLRLCVYWSEVEPSQGNLHLELYHQMLQLCQEKGQHVIVTIGMKAPRWPEFYLPSWVPPDPANQETQNATLTFIERVIAEFQDYKHISAWQVENEPLDPSGPENWVVAEDFLVQECEKVHSLTEKPIILTAWGNELRRRGNLSKLRDVGADQLGIDLYYEMYHRHKLFGDTYVGPHDSGQQLRQEILRLDVPVWVTELQAEPWEKNELMYRSHDPRSMSPSALQANIQRVVQLPVEGVLFWGVEYWLWRATQGDQRYIQVWNEYRLQL